LKIAVVCLTADELDTRKRDQRYDAAHYIGKGQLMRKPFGLSANPLRKSWTLRQVRFAQLSILPN
jgi:hypothetical protein